MPECFLGLAQLFLTEEHEEADADDQLHDEAYPKPRLRQTIADSAAEVREYVPGADFIWCGCSRYHRSYRAQHLRCNEREGNVDSRERLEENHAEAHTLDRIKNA